MVRWHNALWGTRQNLSISHVPRGSSSGQAPSVLPYVCIYYWHTKLTLQIAIDIIWKLWPGALTVSSTTLGASAGRLKLIHHVQKLNLSHYCQAKLELKYFKEPRNCNFLKIYGILNSITFLCIFRQYLLMLSLKIHQIFFEIYVYN